MRYIKNAFIVFPIMGYYFIESLIIAVFTSFARNSVLFNLIKINILYFQWVIMIWIIKTIFDEFKLLTTINNDNEKILNHEIC